MDNNPLIIESKEILDPELIPKYITTEGLNHFELLIYFLP